MIYIAEYHYLRSSDDKTNLPDLALPHDLCLTGIFDLAALMIFANPCTTMLHRHTISLPDSCWIGLCTMDYHMYEAIII
jgi:hypothetical protein